MSWNWKTCLAGAACCYAAKKGWEILNEESLAGQTVVITGGSRGLGFLMAREFAREGCRIAICARDRDELKVAEENLSRHGAEVFAAPCDVADRGQVKDFFAAVADRFGPVDVLVNNAGLIQVGPIEAMSLGDFQKMMDVMYWGTVYPTLEILPHMRRRRYGRIVNITSIGGVVSVPHLLPYNCAKSAAVAFSEGLHAELAGSGIRVTTVVPSVMRIGSHLNARFTGQAAKEFRWFSLGASLPGLSVSGERAARLVVQATKRGKTIQFIGLAAAAATCLHGLLPGATADSFGWANRWLLPSPSNGTHSGPKTDVRGADAQQQLHSPIVDWLTTLGTRAAGRTNQF